MFVEYIFSCACYFRALQENTYADKIVNFPISFSLQIIADFDHTLSRVHKNGKPCSTTYGKTLPYFINNSLNLIKYVIVDTLTAKIF